MTSPLPPKLYVIHTAKEALADLVHNMSVAEENPISIVDVKRLLDGITVGGHKLADQNQVLNLGNAWQALFKSVESGRFELTKK